MTSQEKWKIKVDLFRERFGSRTDVFSVKYTTTKRQENGEIKERVGYSPQCSNFGNQNICLIAKGQGKCHDCDHKKYMTLTDEWIWKHISGQKELVLYMLMEGGIKFGACDFDYGAPFEDAKAVRDVSLELGLPCYIARSSKKGYHLYWFFNAPVPAHLFTSMVRHIYDRLGLYERFLENSEIPLPEVFPKQTRFGGNKLGNGIKPPMVESRFEDGFNCWVDDEAEPLPVNQQWEYLKNCQEITKDQLVLVIKKHNVEVIEAPVNRGRSSAQREKSASANSQNQPLSSPSGDFWKIIEGCAAIRASWEKDDKGNYKIPIPSHMSRVAVLSWALRTENGLQAIRERWPSERAEKEIQYAVETQQRPWTCKAMQEHGICLIGKHPVKGDRCFNKRPPVTRENGIIIENPDNLPESEWPEPSPVRFAKLNFDELSRSLESLIVNRPSDIKEKLKAIIKKAARLTTKDQKKITDRIKEARVLNQKDVKAAKKEGKQELAKEKLHQKKLANPSLDIGPLTLFVESGRYTLSYLDARGVQQERPITNFLVEYIEDVRFIETIDESRKSKGRGTVKGRILRCDLVVDGHRERFEVEADRWMENANSFFKIITKHASGFPLIYRRSDYDLIRTAIEYFGSQNVEVKTQVEDIGHCTYKGEDLYLMPNVIITKESIRHNSEFIVDFKDEVGRQLGFNIIDDKEFKDLALHILNDYFNCNSRLAAMTTFAHALSASVLSHLPLDRSPLLWLEGSQGGGKTFLLQAAQRFYGEFEIFITLSSTDNAKRNRGMAFRDVLLAIDDYKSTLQDNNRSFKAFLQSAYDRTARDASKRTGELRERSTRVRGLLGFSGEEFPINEASTIARLILISVGKEKDTEKGLRVRERSMEYSGFTPHFIQFIYNTDKVQIKKLFAHYVEHFDRPVRDKFDNTLRIAQNLSFNMTTFRLAMELLVAKGVIPEEMKDRYCREHLNNLEIVRANICKYVREQKGVEIFLKGLNELLGDRSNWKIEGLPQYEMTESRGARTLGFWKSTTPNWVYIYPNQAADAVRKLTMNDGSRMQTLYHIARQLADDGHIPDGKWDSSDGRLAKNVVGPHRKRSKVWILNMDSVGLIPPMVEAKEQKNKEEDLDDLPLLQKS